MQSDRLQWPVMAGLILVLMMVVTFALDMAIMGTTGADPVIRADRIGEDLVRVQGSAIWPVEAWVYTLMILPAMVFLLGLFWAFRDQDRRGLVAIGVLVLGVFWALHTVHNIAIVAIVQSLAPAYVPGGPEAAAIESSARGLLGVADALSPLAGLATVFLAAGMFAFGRAARDIEGIPKWNGYIALAIASLSSLGLLQVVSPAFVAAALVSWILSIVWFADLSVLMRNVRRGTHTVGPAVATGS